MFDKKYLKIIVLVCVILNITASGIVIIIPSENIQDANSSTIIFNSEENIQDIINTANDGNSSNEFPKAEKYFPFGVNIDWGKIQYLASRQGLGKIEWIETALDDMQAHHINTLHFNNLFYDQDLELFVSLAEPRGIRLYPQAGGLPYFFPTRLTKEERDDAFNTLVKPAYLKLINRYRDSEGILVWGICDETPPSLAPELNQWTDYIDGLDPNHPAVVCYNRVDSVEAARDIIKPRIIAYDIYPFFADPNYGPITPIGSLNYYEKTIYNSYKAAREIGAPIWVIAQGMELYSHYFNTLEWRYPTPNEIHLEAWAAIVNGAKGILYWTYTSTPYDYSQGEIIYGLVDRDGNPTEQWDTINDLWYELEPLTSIIVDLDESDSSIISNKGEKIRARTFQRSTGEEKYVIVVNTDVENNKPTNLELTTTENIYDLSTLKQVTSDELFNHVLLPGRGNIYLVGNQSDFDEYKDNYVEYNVNGNDDDHPDSINIIDLFINFRFLLLVIAGIIPLVIIVINRRFSSKRHNRNKRHKQYIYKY
ncbi:MAG: hypothetical protein ACFFAH_11975 [Promethearchaeota archaeon]